MSRKIYHIQPMGFQWETKDPFLFCVHHEDTYPKGDELMRPNTSLSGRHLGQDFTLKDGFRMYHGKVIPGFPGHPHRGFETITVVRKGVVDHADSTGSCGRYGNGDVQWMTAGRGVQHSEMFPCINTERTNPLELFQIWLNLPAKSKMSEPHFKMIWSETIPRKTFTDINGNNAYLEVLVGKFQDLQSAEPPPESWAASSANEVAIWHLELEKETLFTLPPAHSAVNRTIYFYSGKELWAEDVHVSNYHAISVDASHDLLLRNGPEPTKVLVLQGKPIAERIVQHGPFVMNSQEEIQEAFFEYQQTLFGGWPWPSYDHVHPRKMPRFARYANGEEEIKD